VTVRILKAGLQTTIQAAPRVGLRHLGVPLSGAADRLSMALANRLVGNAASTSCLEVTISGMRFEVTSDVSVAISGAVAQCSANGKDVRQHETVSLCAGDRVVIGPAERGTRCYVAFAGGLAADDFLGSCSTYMPAGMGGYDGRSLRREDRISLQRPGRVNEVLETPPEFRLPMPQTWTLRAGFAAEADQLPGRKALFSAHFRVGARNNRMGIELAGERLEIQSDGRMPSAPVFPGTIQCPQSGVPFLLSVDSQTTGGYPRVAQVTRADRHLIGQLRQGDQVRFLFREESAALRELRDKQAYWRRWLPDVSDII